MRLWFTQAAQAAVMTTLFTTTAYAQAPAQSIVQRDERFHPNRIVLKRGQTLGVTNEDPFVHHVYVDSPEMKYDSGEQRPGRALSIPFEKPGEYVLECAIHLKMKLRVTVKEE
jgi:plastocyanin